MREVGKTFVDKEKEKNQYKEAIDWEALRLWI